MLKRKKGRHEGRSKIYPGEYIAGHFETLTDQRTGKPGLDDYFSFLALPVFISALFCLLGFKIDSNSIETVVASLAIFVGLLFNALVILIDMARKPSLNPQQRRKFIKQLVANISFSIFLSLVAIPIMLLGFIESFSACIKMLINFIAFFLLAEFLTVFLMVLKRVYILFKEDLKALEKAEK